MRFKITLLTAVIIALMMSIPAAAVETAPQKPEVAAKPVSAKYPFLAEVTGSDVYVRSGKGKAYYHCMKVQNGFKVTVVAEDLGWAKILPPEGSYSWINKNYVKVEDGAPTVGVVTGDNVRVWAGSDYMGPTRSSSMQVKINTGEQVELFANQPETGDYYKIKPPTGAHLWISADFLKYIGKGAVEEAPVEMPAKPEEVKPTETIVKEPLPLPTESEKPTFGNLDEGTPETTVTATEPETTEPVKETTPTPAPVETPKKTDPETLALAKCYEISAKIDEELKKPLNEQNYDEYKKSLEKIATKKDADRASTYAKILIERVDRYQLAISVTDILKQQDKDLAATRKQIEKARETQLKKIPAGAKYMFTGTLKESHVYTERNGQKRYMLLDANGKIQCYAVAAGGTTDFKLSSLIGKKVGINGAVVTGAKSLVALIAVDAVEPIN